jgi:xanthine dehydrogenase YagS FAD-binding subunit
MQAFEYASPATLKDALGLLGSAWGEADALAGGTDLLSLMKEYIHTPKRVVNIKDIKELGGITKTSAGLRIGATATVTDLMNNDTIRSDYPALLQAAQGISSMQIRNMGTVGGDLCQRPRCWYFRSGFGLLGVKDGKSLVTAGENKFHAIFGKGNAQFVSASSFAPALIALGAKLKLVSAAGEREISAADLFVIPASDSDREISLKPNEILTEINIPAGATKNATYEVRQREALDWPLATASVALKMDGSKVTSASIVMGHVGPVPVSATAAAKSLSGKTINESVAEKAAASAVKGAQPLSQTAYKVQLAKVAIKRALLKAAG